MWNAGHGIDERRSDERIRSEEVQSVTEYAECDRNVGKVKKIMKMS